MIYNYRSVRNRTLPARSRTLHLAAALFKNSHCYSVELKSRMQHRFSPAHALGVRLRRIRFRRSRNCSNGEALLLQRSAGSAVA